MPLNSLLLLVVLLLLLRIARGEGEGGQGERGGGLVLKKKTPSGVFSSERKKKKAKEKRKGAPLRTLCGARASFLFLSASAAFPPSKPKKSPHTENRILCLIKKTKIKEQARRRCRREVGLEEKSAREGKKKEAGWKKREEQRSLSPQLPNLSPAPRAQYCFPAPFLPPFARARSLLVKQNNFIKTQNTSTLLDTKTKKPSFFYHLCVETL